MNTKQVRRPLSIERGRRGISKSKALLKKPLVVGVTGGIGSGKSEVCRLFNMLGVQVISADDLAKQLMEINDDIRKKIKKTFGQEAYMVDGTLNRTKLASEVFSNPHRKAQIDEIVHPYVINEIQRIIQSFHHSLLIIEAALIYESGADRLVDYVIVVDADRETRIRRVMERDGVPSTDVLRRVNAQMSPKEKIKRADFVITNNHDLGSLQEKVFFLHKLFTSMTNR
jgi:dephospho-CoA kinase